MNKDVNYEEPLNIKPVLRNFQERILDTKITVTSHTTPTNLIIKSFTQHGRERKGEGGDTNKTQRMRTQGSEKDIFMH